MKGKAVVTSLIIAGLVGFLAWLGIRSYRNNRLRTTSEDEAGEETQTGETRVGSEVGGI